MIQQKSIIVILIYLGDMIEKLLLIMSVLLFCVPHFDKFAFLHIQFYTSIKNITQNFI